MKTMLRFSDSFIRGICRAIDLNGFMKAPAYLENGLHADKNALKGDWQNVGRDIQRGIAKYRATNI